MIKKFNIVLFWYMNDWGLYGRSYENIAKGLANNKQINNVICILPPNIIAKSRFAFELAKPKPNLYVITPNPRLLNTSGALYNLRQWLNNRFTSLNAINFFLRLLGLKKANTILWLFPHHPFITKLLEEIPHSLLVTQIVDNVLNKAGISEETKDLVTTQYDLLPKISNITITSSKLNYEIFLTKSPHCYLVENGLDLSFISSPSNLPHIKNSVRPRLGYLGFISERTDVNLLKKLALARPEYDLIIAGPDEELRLSTAGVLNLPNVSHINYLPYSEAPNFINSLDVCLITHIDSPFSQSMSPLKLFQYLGSGRPIVTTNISGTARWIDLIYIANDHNDFIYKIDIALIENNEVALKRIDAAKNETWDNHINYLMNLINFK